MITSSWIAAIAALSLTGCVSAPFKPPMGIVSATKAPLSVEGNWKLGSKSGEAYSTCILGLYAGGDCSVTAAARDGGLKSVGHVEYKYLNVIGIYQRTTVIAYGE